MRELRSERDTGRFAAELAARLPAGSLLLLRGPLGAGKTTLIRHLARALGFGGRVTSPTYTLMHTYPTPRGELLHVDVYRLPDAAAIYDLGFAEAREEAYLTAVEWGEPEVFPGGLEILLEPSGPQSRRVRLVAHSPELRELAASLSAG
ncbi:tRNA (adenosine(37)-N6)-threonylcarbamoyltransferase complex ATPase subunit type 1 TsaE [Oceanithermus sp.]